MKKGTKNYSLECCENLISKYINELGAEYTELEEGTLGLGKILLHGADGYKIVLIEEFFINHWQSGHHITMFNKMPKKYEEILETI